MHTFIGNLVSDPEVFTNPLRVKVRIACSERYRDKHGEWQDGRPSYHTGWVWGAKAERLSVSGLAKGNPVIMCGKFDRKEWVDPQTREKRSSQDLLVEHIGLNIVRYKPSVSEDTSVPPQEVSADSYEPVTPPEVTGQTPLDTFTGPDSSQQWAE